MPDVPLPREVARRVVERFPWTTNVMRDGHLVSLGIAVEEAIAEAIAADRDPAICRLQFPDGSVPGNIFECAEGWKQFYEAERQAHEASIKEFERVYADIG